jgi:hypothetical protein
MKILYDHQIFSLQKFGGISRYFLETAKYIRQNKLEEIELSLRYSNNSYLQHSLFSKNIQPAPDIESWERKTIQLLSEIKRTKKARF